MYVCLCHGVTEDDVLQHMQAGVCTAKGIRAACGMRPGCGSCVRRICALLDGGEGAIASPGAVGVGGVLGLGGDGVVEAAAA